MDKTMEKSYGTQTVIKPYEGDIEGYGEIIGGTGFIISGDASGIDGVGDV